MKTFANEEERRPPSPGAVIGGANVKKFNMLVGYWWVRLKRGLQSAVKIKVVVEGTALVTTKISLRFVPTRLRLSKRMAISPFLGLNRLLGHCLAVQPPKLTSDRINGDFPVF